MSPCSISQSISSQIVHSMSPLTISRPSRSRPVHGCCKCYCKRSISGIFIYINVRHNTLASKFSVQKPKQWEFLRYRRTGRSVVHLSNPFGPDPNSPLFRSPKRTIESGWVIKVTTLSFGIFPPFKHFRIYYPFNFITQCRSNRYRRFLRKY